MYVRPDPSMQGQAGVGGVLGPKTQSLWGGGVKGSDARHLGPTPSVKGAGRGQSQAPGPNLAHRQALCYSPVLQSQIPLI